MAQYSVVVVEGGTPLKCGLRIGGPISRFRFTPVPHYLGHSSNYLGESCDSSPMNSHVQ